jgi:hypothetical protein
MLRTKIFDALVELKDRLCGQIVIFGTGKVGEITSSVLEEMGIKQYYFVDNDANKFQKPFMGSIVYGPSVLLAGNRENQVILIASSYYEDISTQLLHMGLIEDVHFFSVLKLKRKEHYCLGKLSRLQSKELSDLDIFVLGDSVSSFIADEDKDTTILHEMLYNKLSETYKVYGIHHMGFHFGVFYYILKALLAMGNCPKLVIMPINMRSFSPSWDYNPVHLYTDTINEIDGYLKVKNQFLHDTLGLKEHVAFDDYIRLKHDYPLVGNRAISELIAWYTRKLKEGAPEYELRNRVQFSLHYLLPITEENRKLQALRNIIELCSNHNIRLLTFATPINHEAAKEFCGDVFEKLYNQNINKVCQLFSGVEHIAAFRDYSSKLDREQFRHRSYQAEHLNESGRRKLADILCEDIRL